MQHHEWHDPIVACARLPNDRAAQGKGGEEECGQALVLQGEVDTRLRPEPRTNARGEGRRVGLGLRYAIDNADEGSRRVRESNEEAGCS